MAKQPSTSKQDQKIHYLRALLRGRAIDCKAPVGFAGK